MQVEASLAWLTNWNENKYGLKCNECNKYLWKKKNICQFRLFVGWSLSFRHSFESSLAQIIFTRWRQNLRAEKANLIRLKWIKEWIWTQHKQKDQTFKIHPTSNCNDINSIFCFIPSFRLYVLTFTFSEQHREYLNFCLPWIRIRFCCWDYPVMLMSFTDFDHKQREIIQIFSWWENSKPIHAHVIISHQCMIKEVKRRLLNSIRWSSWIIENRNAHAETELSILPIKRCKTGNAMSINLNWWRTATTTQKK